MTELSDETRAKIRDQIGRYSRSIFALDGTGEFLESLRLVAEATVAEKELMRFRDEFPKAVAEVARLRKENGRLEDQLQRTQTYEGNIAAALLEKDQFIKFTESNRDEWAKRAEERLEEVFRLRAFAEWVRPELRQFALRMEERLRANDHKSHWANSTEDMLFVRLEEELEELRGAVAVGMKDAVIHEAADVANFAMMLADNSGRLGESTAPEGK